MEAQLTFSKTWPCIGAAGGSTSPCSMVPGSPLETAGRAIAGAVFDKFVLDRLEFRADAIAQSGKPGGGAVAAEAVQAETEGWVCSSDHARNGLAQRSAEGRCAGSADAERSGWRAQAARDLRRAARPRSICLRAVAMFSYRSRQPLAICNSVTAQENAVEEAAHRAWRCWRQLPHDAAQRVFGLETGVGAGHPGGDRLLYERGCLRRLRRASRRRPELAGHASVARPRLGSSGIDCLYRGDLPRNCRPKPDGRGC